MGQLVDGKWHAGWGKPSTAGTFERQPTVFRDHVPAVSSGRYHLYVARACPWAHRTLITRSLRGLDHAIGVTVVDPHMGADGWPFKADDPDPIGPSRFLRDVYLRADPHYTGRVTVPVLWDRETHRIVNNESREIMRMLDLDFASLAIAPMVNTLYPPDLRGEIDRILDAIYEPVNNGVYRAGFASTQEAYAAACTELFRALAHWDDELSGRPFLCGSHLTAADIALFTTCLRFDLVYYSQFKCNVKRLRDHTNLWKFTRRMWSHPGVRPTCFLDEIKTHYYWSQDNVNPTRIVPLGPSEYERDLDAPI